MRIKKFLTGTVLFIGLIIALFIFGLRSCLSAYDERSALPPSVYVEKDGRAVLFTIVEFSKATSYSQNGGMINKTVDDEYYIQVNDAVSGKKIKAAEIDLSSRPKNFPIEILGVSETTVWIFIDGVRAFDAFTLKEVATRKTIEEKNPAIKDRLPAERRFYDFDTTNQTILFKANDGAPWVLDTKTLLVRGGVDKPATYSDPRNELVYRKESLNKMNVSFSQIKLNQDTIAGKWYGIFSPQEWNDQQERVTINTENLHDQRRQFIAGNYDSVANYQRYVINKTTAQVLPAAGYFLDGGFLADKNTGAAIQLSSPDGHLLVSKEKIGNDGNIMVTRIDIAGKQLWQYNTGLKEFADWQVHGPRFYIFGTDNKELNSSQVNILQIVNLMDGSVVKYDFFKDK